MPAARVRMMRLDSVTRRTLTTAGVTDSQPAAFIAVAPYRADCRTIRYADSMPFALPEDDWQVAGRMTSRLRGTYRVELQLGGERRTWFFRTHDKPGYRWNRADSLQTTAELLELPTIPGYLLVGLAAATGDSLPADYPRGGVRGPLVWLGTVDRPTTPANDSRVVLPGELMFHMGAAPEPLWDALEALVRPPSRSDSLLMAQVNRPIERDRLQPRIPITVRLDANGGVRADTALAVRGGTLRVMLERVDTLAVVRPF